VTQAQSMLADANDAGAARASGPALVATRWAFRGAVLDLSRRFRGRLLAAHIVLGVSVRTASESDRTLGAVGVAPVDRAGHSRGRNMTMVARNVSSKIDDDASKDKGLAAKASTKITEVADKAGNVAMDAQGKVGDMAKMGGHRLQETAKKAGHIAEEIATKVIHSAQETAQKVVHGAKEVANKAEHRLQERADKADNKRKGQ
jgi:hypothetical protein